MLFLSINKNRQISLLPWQPKKQYTPFNLAVETAFMAHAESISKMWSGILDGDLQSKTFVAIISRNRQIWGKKWRYLLKIAKGLYLSLLLQQQLKLSKCTAFMTRNSLWSFFFQFFRTYRQNDISSVFTHTAVTSYHLHFHTKMEVPYHKFLNFEWKHLQNQKWYWKTVDGIFSYFVRSYILDHHVFWVNFSFNHNENVQSALAWLLQLLLGTN